MDSFIGIIADIDRFTGPEASDALAKLALREEEAVIAAAHPSSVKVFVDGQEGRSLTDAKREIRFEFGYLGEVLTAIHDAIRTASPYREKRLGANPETHYRDENIVLLNGVEVSDLPADLPADAVVTFCNLQPYAFKIERGKSPQAPDGVYGAVAELMQRQFGNAAQIDYGLVSLSGDAPRRAMSRKNTTSRARGAYNSHPAISVRMFA